MLKAQRMSAIGAYNPDYGFSPAMQGSIVGQVVSKATPALKKRSQNRQTGRPASGRTVWTSDHSD
jgi:hypothetical protein